ncbi:MAG: hypothetical protein IJ715_01800 [Bacilli bacterium]|nr:hypothetical protein [Bacilli bacterium]
MNNYYLVAFDIEPKIIEITIDGDKKIATSIQNIDKKTSNFSMKQIKDHLVNIGKISSNEIEILIMHQTKYNGKAYLKTHFVLTENEYLPVISNKVKVSDVSKLIITFFNKCKKDSFKEFVQHYYEDINLHTVKNFQRIFANMFINPLIRDEYVKYQDVRSLASVIACYDRFKDIRTYEDYLFNINRYILNNKEHLLEMTDINNIHGQISFSFEGNNVVYHEMNKIAGLDENILKRSEIKK